MPAQSVQTWRQILFAAIVLTFIGATVGTAFGMVRTSNAASERASQHASQPGVSPSASASPSVSPGTADQVSDQTATNPDNTGTGAGTTQTQNTNRCKVPKVIGWKEADARKKLTDCGLTINQVKYLCEEQTEAGKVLWQSPDADNTVDRGGKASLNVQGVLVRNVVGQYYGDAKSMLEHDGFKVNINNLQPGASGGSVSAQNPAANSCQKWGSTVTITVGTKTTTSSAPPSAAADQATSG